MSGERATAVAVRQRNDADDLLLPQEWSAHHAVRWTLFLTVERQHPFFPLVVLVDHQWLARVGDLTGQPFTQLQAPAPILLEAARHGRDLDLVAPGITEEQQASVARRERADVG